MNKKFILLIIISLLLFSLGFYFWHETQKSHLSQIITYRNPFYGYELNIPISWQNKFTLGEEENKTEFLYLKNTSQPIEKKESIFTILVYSNSQWEQIKKEPGYHGSEIYSDENLSFVFTLPLENPYAIEKEFNREAEEFQKMVGQVPEIIKTFKYQPSSISCARKNERINKNPLIGPTLRKCCSGLSEWRESNSAAVCLKPTDEGLVVYQPQINEKIKSPLKIKGEAKGFWFFEAEFRAELYDENENFLGRAILTARDDWMTEGFVPFEGELNFSSPSTTTGILKFLSANPSGLTENQKIFELPVKFEEMAGKEILLYYYNPEKDRDETGNLKCSRDGLVPIKRTIPYSLTPIKETINLLLKGKENLTQEEISSGLTTEYPLEKFSLEEINLKRDGTLILKFNDPLNKTIGGSCRVGILWFQIEETAKQFPEVRKVEFLPPEIFQP
ncbi:MAG: GerMN domain-containing protein [Patescibacteria group bacterium]|nr:GerMN domain-containing protein [Patescibacteria group bacterium]